MIENPHTVIGRVSQPRALYTAGGYFSFNCSVISITMTRNDTPICGAANPTYFFFKLIFILIKNIQIA